MLVESLFDVLKMYLKLAPEELEAEPRFFQALVKDFPMVDSMVVEYQVFTATSADLDASVTSAGREALALVEVDLEVLVVQEVMEDMVDQEVKNLREDPEGLEVECQEADRHHHLRRRMLWLLRRVARCETRAWRRHSRS